MASSRADIVSGTDTFPSSLVGSHFVAASDGGGAGADVLPRRGFSLLPVLATIRTSVEGGEAHRRRGNNSALVRRLASFAGGGFLDLTRRTSALHRREAWLGGAIVVASFHDFEGTPGDEQLAEVPAAMNYAGADVLVRVHGRARTRPAC